MELSALKATSSPSTEECIYRMPFAFSLPTTSALSLSSCLGSNTHPSLPQSATIQRNVLRSVLKKHKRLPPKAQSSDISSVQSALNEYLSYLLAIDASLSGKSLHGEEVELSLQEEFEVEWRSTLSIAIPGREPRRLKGKGLEYEICFILASLAYTHIASARVSLLTLYGSVTPSVELRVKIIQNATKLILAAGSIHAYLSLRALETDASSAVVESLSQTHSALKALALAEATLLAVLKDDPHPFVVAQARNKDDKDWMIKAPEIPKVRAHLFARLCLAAAEHAATAEAGLSATGRVTQDLIEYVGDLKKTARAKACRLFGIDAELEGETGKAIAWLRAAKKELGFAVEGEGRRATASGLKKIKQDWMEKREDRKIEKGGEWGSDAGRFEELRVTEYLEAKWTKMNDTVCLAMAAKGHLTSDNLIDQHAIDSTIRFSCS